MFLITTLTYRTIRNSCHYQCSYQETYCLLHALPSHLTQLRFASLSVMVCVLLLISVYTALVQYENVNLQDNEKRLLLPTLLPRNNSHHALPSYAPNAHPFRDPLCVVCTNQSSSSNPSVLYWSSIKNVTYRTMRNGCNYACCYYETVHSMLHLFMFLTQLRFSFSTLGVVYYSYFNQPLLVQHVNESQFSFQR